ncbi:MAG: hypothetical protein O2992_11560, partial [Gemmatimonadetes bacterium]|nr:hypothetical protein [Gemmatimonadota bacterium]
MFGARLFALAFLFVPTADTASSPDPYPRRIGIDVEHYRFELMLSDDTDEIVGNATVLVRFTSSGVVELPLDLTSRGMAGRGMEVRRVSAR